MNPNRIVPLLIAAVLNVATLLGQQKLSREEYIRRYKGLAVEEMDIYGIPASITELAKRYGKEVSRSDIPTMVANAQKDACGLTNPRKMTDAAVQQLYEIAF